MSDEFVFSKTELLAQIRTGWDNLHGDLRTLSPEQLTGPTDAAGWTAKDHVMHLAVWEDGICALLNQQDRRERMGLDEDTWQSEDFDRINAALCKQHQAMTWDAINGHFQKVHNSLMETLDALTEEDLLRPYEYYQLGAGITKPVWHWVAGNTYAHYDEHRPWIAAIVE